MPETRHGDWMTDWERIDATRWDLPGHPRRLVYWNRVVRGADGRGRTERLTVSRAQRGDRGRWVWMHLGPEPRPGKPAMAKIHAQGTAGTTQAAKAAADAHFRNELRRDQALATRGQVR